MGTSVRIEINREGIRDLLNSDEVRADLTSRMERVESAAIASAPIGATGEHRDSIHIEQATTDRAAVRVVADSDHSLGVEARTGHMARALDAAGGA